MSIEGKERFGTKYEENCKRSDCRMRIQGMSDLFMHDCVDIVWDDFFLDDDRMVPHHGLKRLNDHFTRGENNKSCRREFAGISNNTGGSVTKCVDHDKDRSGVSHMSKTRNTTLEKDPWSCEMNSPIACVSDNELIKEASSLACDSTMPPPHDLKSNNRDLNSGEVVKHSSPVLNNNASLVDDSLFNFPVGDINQTSNHFFENAENKDSSDPLYYGWSEIENFDDIDRMFSSDSTLGLGICKEDELSWLSSADDIGRSGDALRSDAKYTYSDPSEVKTISENHDFSNGNSLNNFSRTNAPIRYKDCSWTSEKSDSFRSFLTGPDIKDDKDGFIPLEQVIGFNSKIQPRFSISSHFRPGAAAVTSEHNKKIKLQSQFAVNPDQAIVKSETNDLATISSRNSDHASSQLQYMDGFSGPPFKGTAQGNHDRLQNGSLAIQASISDSGLVEKYENHCDPPGASSANEAETGSSNMQESSIMVPELDDISLEAASFRQLQLVTKQLDLRTKICIRNSLYRLAQSAEQRRGNPNLFEDERDAGGGASEAEGTKRCAGFMDMETDTNPIDRSVAHLLFHRPSDSTQPLVHDSLINFQSPSVVHGSAASPAVLSDSFASEENVTAKYSSEY